MDDFNKRFGLKNPNVEETKKRFLNRVNSHIFKWLEEDGNFSSSNFVHWISLELGGSWDDKFEEDNYRRWYVIFRKITSDDFLRTLQIIEKSYKFINEGGVKGDDRYEWDYTKKINSQNFSRKLEEILALTEGDIGVFWKNGKFYKAGAKELDDQIIKDTLDWLHKYPEVEDQFNVALNHFKNSKNSMSARKDSITNAYSAIERLAKLILNNKDSFDKNSDRVVNYLNLTKEYKNIFHWYKQVAHEYSSRHAGSKFDHIEAEAFIYMTGLLMRLILQK